MKVCVCFKSKICSKKFAATNYAAAYGSGVRGVLPNGTPVIVDNNVATNLGAGTNEDEIYILSRRECHLWEDPSAPMLIRAEQTAAASLGVLFVVYGYIAFTHARYAHSQKLAGTGTHEIRGFAWSGRGKIAKVDVSTDGGKNWREAVLDDPVLDKCLTCFRLPWNWNGGPAVLQSRAMDSTGYVQPSIQEIGGHRGIHPYLFVQHHNGIQSWAVTEKGEVSNVIAS